MDSKKRKRKKQEPELSAGELESQNRYGQAIKAYDLLEYKYLPANEDFAEYFHQEEVFYLSNGDRYVVYTYSYPYGSGLRKVFTHLVKYDKRGGAESLYNRVFAEVYGYGCAKHETDETLYKFAESYGFYFSEKRNKWLETEASIKERRDMIREYGTNAYYGEGIYE